MNFISQWHQYDSAAWAEQASKKSIERSTGVSNIKGNCDRRKKADEPYPEMHTDISSRKGTLNVNLRYCLSIGRGL